MFKEYPNHMLDQVIFQIKFYPLLKLYSDAPEVASEENQYHVGALPAHDLSNQLYFQVLRRQISLKSSLQIKR